MHTLKDIAFMICLQFIKALTSIIQSIFNDATTKPLEVKPRAIKYKATIRTTVTVCRLNHKTPVDPIIWNSLIHTFLSKGLPAQKTTHRY